MTDVERIELMAPPWWLRILAFASWWADKVMEGMVMLLGVGVLAMIVLGGGCAIMRIAAVDPVMESYWRLVGQRVIIVSIVCCWIPYMVFVAEERVVAGLLYLLLPWNMPVDVSLLHAFVWALAVATTAWVASLFDPPTALSVVLTALVVVTTAGLYTLARARGAPPAFS